MCLHCVVASLLYSLFGQLILEYLCYFKTLFCNNIAHNVTIMIIYLKMSYPCVLKSTCLVSGFLHGGQRAGIFKNFGQTKALHGKLLKFLQTKAVQGEIVKILMLNGVLCGTVVLKNL